jgi:hypothetical protein
VIVVLHVTFTTGLIVSATNLFLMVIRRNHVVVVVLGPSTAAHVGISRPMIVRQDVRATEVVQVAIVERGCITLRAGVVIFGVRMISRITLFS